MTVDDFSGVLIRLSVMTMPRPSFRAMFIIALVSLTNPTALFGQSVTAKVGNADFESGLFPPADNPSAGVQPDSLPVRCPAGRVRFGPFVVRDRTHAELAGSTTSSSADQFAELLDAYPDIHVLDITDSSGTFDDYANLQIGRMIHAHGVETEIPSGGSVRSGAVDLFVAGVVRHAAPDAIFAVHAWVDQRGLGPFNFRSDSPVNLAYINYYQLTGMSRQKALTFYQLTNSVPHNQVLWLGTADIALFVPIDQNVEFVPLCPPHVERLSFQK